LILGACAWAAFGQGLLPNLFNRGNGGDGEGNDNVFASDVLRVGVGDGGTATITEALAKASPGQTVLVAPGEYRETLQLRNGVRLVSEVPRGARILPPVGSGVPAVTAQGVSGGRVEGFRILGDAQTPLQVGLRLVDSDVVVDGVEVSGAQTAAIDFAGKDRSTVRYSYLHDNPGVGVIAGGSSLPRLLQNLIFRNGRAAGAPARPGIEVRDQARPSLIGNRIEGNAGGGVTTTAADWVDEVFLWNSFGSVPRNQAIRVSAPITPQTPGQAP
jgi:hypothetical protein